VSNICHTIDNVQYVNGVLNERYEQVRDGTQRKFCVKLVI